MNSRLISSGASLIAAVTTLVACFLVVAFSWPDPDHRTQAARSVPIGCCDVVVGTPVLSPETVVPVVLETGSLPSRRQSD